MNRFLMNMPLCLLCLASGISVQAQEPDALMLENGSIGLSFDRATGCLVAVRNKLTGEMYQVRGDEFAVTAVEFSLEFSEFNPVSVDLTDDRLAVRYESPAMTAEVQWTLGGAHNFAEKRMTLTSADDCGLKQIVVSQPEFVMSDLKVVCYRHPDFDWISDYVRAKHGGNLQRPPASEPARTFFGRTNLGGLFTGLEMPYDNSRQGRGQNAVILGYTPNLKVRAGEPLICDSMYLGIYRRSNRDAHAAEWAPISAETIVGHSGAAGLSVNHERKNTLPVTARVLPLPSESEAMVAMTSAILGPPRHGLMAFACGWHCQMEQAGYNSEDKLEGDLRSLEFLASCDLDGVTDSHPWGGETAKMGTLREGDHYVLDTRVRRFVESARELGLNVTQWPTMNNTHPWREYGIPFRLDRPEWLRGVEGEALGGAGADEFQRRKANCLACVPFYKWLEQIIVDDALGTGLYESWAMDGDFWGTGAYFNTTLPVTCFAANHEHLPGDANYACQRRLVSLVAEVRQRYPDIYIIMCRPLMDLGIWGLRNVDACFTLIESGTGGSNITGGNEVRTASRIRVHHHFFPHWLDQSLLFPSYGNPKRLPPWPSEKIDYIMISALSCSPNLLLYLPTKNGIPEADKAEIRKWLIWGRENIEYLLVRKDLQDWPAPGKVDGSAHFVDDKGLVFLFNPGSIPLSGEFVLNEESTGLTYHGGDFRIAQEYPPSDRRIRAAFNETVRWELPAETAMVLRVQPTEEE